MKHPLKPSTNLWWGPPKKFSTLIEERKISWLELFYDLVYVILISKITHHLATHPNLQGVLDYSYVFMLVFWGWWNGSLYHDLHGSPGIRTRFMTLWQMMAAAAFAVALSAPSDQMLHMSTIALAVLQILITYLWWSVGIYDKEHRKLNKPYTYCYLVAFALLVFCLFVPMPEMRFLYWGALIFNYIPAFITRGLLKRSDTNISLSKSMVERLGLFTIILFGEAILGVINGTISVIDHTNTIVWVCFGLGILIVFALWWIFFALIADRDCQPGFLKGQVLALLFIPILSALGTIGATFSGMLIHFEGSSSSIEPTRLLFGISLAVFLISITLGSRLLLYPKVYEPAKRILQPMVFTLGILILAVTLVLGNSNLILYLSTVFVLLLILIVVITRGWIRAQIEQLAAEH